MSFPRPQGVRLTLISKTPTTSSLPFTKVTFNSSKPTKRLNNEDSESSQPSKKLKVKPPPETVSLKDSFEGPWPTNIRLQIWSLLNPPPHMLIQGRLLSHRPMATFMQPRKTPVVLQICRESRYEYLYREDDNANRLTTRDHNLYRQCFQGMNNKMVYFSFEVDELWLMNFRVAEPLVRQNLKIIVIGPRPTTRLHYYHHYDSSYHMRGGHLLAPNIFQQSCGCWIQQLWTNKCADYRYNFKDLRRFPALQKLVVLIEKTHLEDKEQKRKIEEKINRLSSGFVRRSIRVRLMGRHGWLLRRQTRDSRISVEGHDLLLDYMPAAARTARVAKSLFSALIKVRGDVLHKRKTLR
ncbi:hypothetical protein DL98DRAFT_589358 [Cadophora sp. DSE1049]|nr:hypothetical protein DL98DRAFT_589358 [Cadophora sp. DSE1049]